MHSNRLAFALSGIAALSLAATSCNSQKKKEDSEVVNQTAAVVGPQKVWLILKDQANVSSAKSMKDWRARGQFVYDKLTQTAAASQAPLRQRLKDLGVAHKAFWILNAIQIEADQATIDILARDPAVATVMRARTYDLPHPMPGTEQVRTDALEWGVSNIKAQQVWSQYNVRGEGIVIANIDTGVQFDHPALVRQYRGNKGNGVFDHNYNWFDPSKVCGGTGLAPCDNHDHGTHTMGTMVGEDESQTNQIGVAPGAKWIAAKGCENTTVSCSDTALLASGQWVLAPTDLDGLNAKADLRPHIVNN